MASLRTMVGRFRDELREGVAYVVFWKNGKSWSAEGDYGGTRWKRVMQGHSWNVSRRRS